MPLLGQRPQALRQDLEGARVDAELALLRPPEHPLRAHEVGDIQLAPEGKDLGRKLLLAEGHLQLRAVLHEAQEDELSERAHAHHAADDRELAALGGEGLGVLRVVQAAHLGEGHERPDPRREGVEPALAERREPRAAGLVLLVAHAGPAPAPAARHSRAARISRSMSPSSTPSAFPTSRFVRWSFTRCAGWSV